MTKQEYISEFEKHLRVAEPKRGEILVELNAHLDELEEGADITVVMGKPNELAAKYDRVHIGFFSKPWRLYLIPIIVTLVFASWSNWNQIMNFHFADPAYAIATLVRGMQIIVAILLVCAVARLSMRFQRPARIVTMLLLINFLVVLSSSMISQLSWQSGTFQRREDAVEDAAVATPANTIHAMDSNITFQESDVVYISPNPTLGVTLWLATLEALLSTLAVSLVFFIVVIYVTPINWVPRAHRARRKFEILLAIPLSAAMYVLCLGFTKMAFVPYDTFPTEFRPLESTFIRQLNDFFEKGFGAHLLSMIASGAFILFLMYRWKKYGKYLQKYDGVLPTPSSSPETSVKNPQ